MRYTIIMLLVCSVLTVSGQSQDSTGVLNKRIITLEECMKIAMEKNIQLKRSENNAAIASGNYFQSMMEFLPSINATANYDLYNGTFFDNTAARQVSAVTNSSNPNINANMVVFNGFRNHYVRKSAMNRRDASTSAVENQKQIVESSVLSSYLNVMLDKENIKISENRITLLTAQLEREKKRNSVGVGNLEQVYNFQSQLANENLNLVNLKNSLMSDRLTLMQILQLEDASAFEVAPYKMSTELSLLSKENFSEVLSSSMAHSPSIKQAVALSESAKYDYKSAKANYLPTISLYGQIGSGFSSNGARNPENGEYEEGATFSDQMAWNKFDYVNLSLNIPVFNKWRTRTTTQTAKLGMDNAVLDLEQAEVTVTNAIQQVYINLIAAQETYKAAQENLVALTQSFDYVKTRYDAGNTDFYTYLESLNNKNSAEIQLINAKYSIVFRKKILDVYRGLL